MKGDADDKDRAKERAREHLAVQALRLRTDLVCAAIASGEVSYAEAMELASECRRWAEEHFPDKMALFDMIYMSRFERLISRHILDRPSPDGPAQPEG